jgi:uncharacterized membrane protein YsdA (DUF1294 family)
LAALAGINLLTFAVFGHDKAQARAGGRWVSEARLIFFALCGGWAGAKLAQRRFRHKTRKQPFGRVLNVIPLIWLAGAVLAWWLWPV